MAFTYNATVVNVHDGDTLSVDVDLGWKTWRRNEPLRLLGLDAPELATPAGKASRAFLVDLLPVGSAVVVTTEKDKTEKYGRMLATVTLGGLVVNDHLIDSGHAVAWDGVTPKPYALKET